MLIMFRCINFIYELYKLIIRTHDITQKRLIALQLKPRKGKDIKWNLIENIYSLFRELFL
jgi:hypothetical protein